MTATFRIAADGTGDLLSIEQAYAQAPPGSILEIYPGTYEVSLKLTKPMTFIGKRGREPVILQSHSGSCLSLHLPLLVQLQDLSIRGYSQFHPAIVCHQGRLILDHCDIQQGACPLTAAPSLCLIPAVDIQGEGATPLLQHCRIHHNIGLGINIESGASPAFQECDIYASQDEGVWIHNASPLFSNCRIYGNLGHGVHLDGAGQARFIECDIFNNGSGIQTNIIAGINLSHDAECTFLKCHIHHHIGFGILSTLSSRVTFEQCDIYENNGIGIAILEGSDLLFRKCHIFKNGDVGSFWGMESLGILDECQIFLNGKSGLMIDQNANVVLLNSEVYHNTWQGIVASRTSNLTLSDCHVYENKGEGIEAEEGCELLFRNCFLASSLGLGVAFSSNGSLVEDGKSSEKKWSWPEGCYFLKNSIREDSN